MDSRDRNAIEELFEKIARVEERSGPRDREAEAYIRAQIAAQPGAPYYMAQTIVVQEQALNAAQARISELEERGAPETAGSGVLGGIFGRGGEGRSAGRTRRGAEPLGASRGTGGGGFLAGAAQTAMGVAGGVFLGSMLADWLSPDQADAAGLGDGADGLEETADMQGGDAGDFGGDFDLGDF